MRQIAFLVVTICSIIFTACSKDEVTVEGDWDDNIHLSQKEVEFDSNENSMTITTSNGSWWFTGIFFNDNWIDLGQQNQHSQTFFVETPEFIVERSGNVIEIKMNANSTNVDRLLYISLQNGNYFSGIRVEQKAN